MTTLREAAQQALEALEDARTFTGAWPTGSKAITNLRAALAQQAEPVQEPVDAHTTTLRNLLECCLTWKLDARVLGNVTARQAITALRAALAQQAEPVQEPVAWIQPDHLQKARIAPFLCRVEPTQRCADFVPLYLSPPQRKPQTLDDAMQQPQRKPLTKEEIDNICRQAHGGADPQEWARNFARAIERAHGIGEQP